MTAPPEQPRRRIGSRRVDWNTRVSTALGRFVQTPKPAHLPTGRMVELPGRGSTFVVDVPGPPGAPTLVLLHALGCTAYLSWFPALAALAQDYRVVAFDQRWHGRGIRSPQFRFDDCADDVVAVADALGIERFTVVGYSMGGAIAQLVWRRHPERVDGLVLAATSRNFRGRVRERIWFRMSAAAMGRLGTYAHRRTSRLAATLSPEPAVPTAEEMQVSSWAMAEFRSTSMWAMLAVLDEIGRFDSAPWVGGVTAPTSVVVVTNDRMIPTRRQRRLADSIPSSVTFEVEGSHSALVLGADAFVPVLLEACRSVTRRALDRAAG